MEQASVTRFPPLLVGSGGASGAIIPKQLEHIQLYVLQCILWCNWETVLYTAVALRKLHGICSTRSTALLWHLAKTSLMKQVFDITKRKWKTNAQHHRQTDDLWTHFKHLNEESFVIRRG